MVADTFLAQGIHLHFDVGPNNGLYTASTTDPYRYVPSANARGGELVSEQTCDQTLVTCQFPAFPGTVGWMLGFDHFAKEPVGVNGQELMPGQEDAQRDLCANPSYAGNCRTRFDQVRTGLFHHVFYVHARAVPRSLPCLDEEDNPVPYSDGGTCLEEDNPAFNPVNLHVPTSSSGIANLPGSRVMVSLGLWDTIDYVGSPFVQASTTMHELGHNIELYHGGATPVWGNAATATVIEPNCKPNYLSVMSYLFQARGLFDDVPAHAGLPQLNYSTLGPSQISSINENAMSPGTLARTRCRTARPGSSLSFKARRRITWAYPRQRSSATVCSSLMAARCRRMGWRWRVQTRQPHRRPSGGTRRLPT